MTIVEDHGLIAQTVAAALTARGTDVTVVDPAAGTDELLASVTGSRPDLVLLDLDLGEGRSGLALIEPLAAADVPVVMVTGIDDPVRHAECVAAGAVGVLSKAGSFDDLVGAIERAFAAGTLLSPGERNEHLALLRQHREREQQRLAPFDALTRREAEVLGHLMRGRSVDEIASDAYVSVATVRTQVRAILGKLDVNSQLAATAKANDAGWVPPQGA